MLLLGNKESNLIRPVAVLRDSVIFPSMSIPLAFGRPKSIEAILAAQHENYEIILVAQKENSIENPANSEIYLTGTLAKIHQVLKTPSGAIQAQVEGQMRVRIKRIIKTDPFLSVEAVTIPEPTEESTEIEALKRRILEDFQKIVMAGRNIPMEIAIGIFNADNLYRLTEMIVLSLNASLKDRQELLEIENLRDRLAFILKLLEREKEIQEISKKITSRTQGELGKMQREVFLREQLKSIQKELGGEGSDEFGDLDKAIKTAGMPEVVQKHSLKELDRLRKMPSFGPETSYIRTYLDWMVSLPWAKKDTVKIDLKAANKILNKDHFGLEKVKDRILEYLAVQKLAHGAGRAQILCFVGPPGVGKTSIGQSIAKALGRKFARISLGGIRDEAEIRGHRRTYVGALPGRIIQGIKQAGTKNPVFMLDEIDKVGADFRGDPSSALLEVLDPEQNQTFSDHYLEMPFDLSEVFFVATANVLDTIPPALLDRLEIISFAGYTEDEKYNIAREFLIPKVLESHGLNKNNFKLSSEAVRTLIRHYTREAGVRNLERQLAALARKIARQIAEGKKNMPTITERSLSRLLGPARYRPQGKEEVSESGLVQGLAVTEAGGEVLSVEVTRMPGKGNLILTGQLGEVMKESAQAAMSYARSRATKEGIEAKIFTESDWHIHVPAGAIPKDGPSAGIALATAIYSVATGRSVRNDLAMTGEVTLRGRVLEIGGVKEKVLAAHRAGIMSVILPEDNRKDSEDIPIKVRKSLKLIFLRNMDEVVKVALNK